MKAHISGVVGSANWGINWFLAAAIGVGLALLFTRVVGAVLPFGTAEAHLDPFGHTSAYNYTDSQCIYQVDPISVVLYDNATLSNAHTHAHHHGGWDSHDGVTDQYFYDHWCGPMDGADASNPWWDINGRYHMRYWYYNDGTWGFYTLTTPHHEDVACGTNHAVDSNQNEPPGGYVMAKWDIGSNWHDWNGGGGSHYFGGSQFWGNQTSFWQCDGEPAWNDGYVDFVRIS